MLLAVAVLAALASPPEEPVSRAGGDLLVSCLNHFNKAKLSRHAESFCSCFVVDFTHNITDEQIESADGVMTERIQKQMMSSTERCIEGKPPAVAREGWKWINK